MLSCAHLHLHYITLFLCLSQLTASGQDQFHGHEQHIRFIAGNRAHVMLVTTATTAPNIRQGMLCNTWAMCDRSMRQGSRLRTFPFATFLVAFWLKGVHPWPWHGPQVPLLQIC
jgi:hypothetical protein